MFQAGCFLNAAITVQISEPAPGVFVLVRQSHRIMIGCCPVLRGSRLGRCSFLT
jgi:hypothetical protein